MPMNDLERAYLKKFGQMVRTFRKRKGLSQERLGFLAGLDRSYIGGVERGERNLSLTKIHRIASALEVKPEAIFKELSDSAVQEGKR